MIASNDLYLDLTMRSSTNWIYDGLDLAASGDGNRDSESVPNLTRRFAAWLDTNARARTQLLHF